MKPKSIKPKKITNIKNIYWGLKDTGDGVIHPALYTSKKDAQEYNSVNYYKVVNVKVVEVK